MYPNCLLHCSLIFSALHSILQQRCCVGFVSLKISVFFNMKPIRSCVFNCILLHLTLSPEGRWRAFVTTFFPSPLSINTSFERKRTLACVSCLVATACVAFMTSWIKTDCADSRMEADAVLNPSSNQNRYEEFGKCELTNLLHSLLSLDPKNEI